MLVYALGSTICGTGWFSVGTIGRIMVRRIVHDVASPGKPPAFGDVLDGRGTPREKGSLSQARMSRVMGGGIFN